MASLASPTAARLRCPTNRSRSAVRGDLIGNRLQNAPSEDLRQELGRSPRRSPSLCRQGRVHHEIARAAACTCPSSVSALRTAASHRGSAPLSRNRESKTGYARGGVVLRQFRPAGRVIMKLIIHGWPDEQAVAILRNVHAAAGGDATVLLIGTDPVSPDHDRESSLIRSPQLRRGVPGPNGSMRRSLEGPADWFERASYAAPTPSLNGVFLDGPRRWRGGRIRSAMTTTDVPPLQLAPQHRRDKGSSTSMTTGSSRSRSASSRWSTPTMTATTD